MPQEVSAEKTGNRFVTAIAKLIDLTQKGELRWNLPEAGEQSVLVEQDDEHISQVFIAHYHDKILKIYKRTYKDYRKRSVSFADSLKLSMFSGEREIETYWKSDVVLEFINPDGMTIWTFPQMRILQDLLAAVQYQVAGVEDFLDDILGDTAE
ncbi:MAG: hypothetical protein ACLFVO_03795 [Chloroflexaceae bacterium]